MLSPVRPLPNNITDSQRSIWYYTYILKSDKDNNFYTGTTLDLERRLNEHNAGTNFSTRHRRPFKLIYFEACLKKDDAYRRERYLKSTMGKRFLRTRLKGGLTG